MFNFLENAELLKEKNKQKKIEYGKELLLQIEQKKLKKLEDKMISNNEKSKIKRISNLSHEHSKLFKRRNDKLSKELEKLRNSLDKPLNNNINTKFKNIKTKKIIKNLSFLKIKTDCNYNNPKYSNIRFNFNDNYNLSEKNLNTMQNNENAIKSNLSQMIKGISLKHNNIKSKINFDNKILMEEIDIQFLFKGFMDQQIKIINDYSTNLENIFYLHYTSKENDLNIFNFLIKNEKNKALYDIKKEKNKLKNKFGFFPMETIYDTKIEQLFNKILSKINSIYFSLNHNSINNYINQENSTINMPTFNDKNIFNNFENNFHKNNKISNGSSVNQKYKQNLIESSINRSLSNKINIEEDLHFFGFWKKKFECEIMKEKNKIFDTNETIILNNINENINNIKENNFKIFPANNFLKNIQYREINKISINKIKNKEKILPKIILKNQNFKKRNKSASNKYSEKIFSFF